MTNKDDNNNAADNVPESFTVSAASSHRLLMIAVIIIDLGLLGFLSWMFFGDGYLKDVFQNNVNVARAVMAVILLDAVFSIFFAIKSGFCSNLKIDGDVLTAGGRTYKRDDITGMKRSGRGNKKCKIIAGSKVVCEIDDSFRGK